MSKSSRKGANGEREWAEFTGGVKLSRLGYTGPDVLSPPCQVTDLKLWEVKRVLELPKWLQAWLDQTVDEGADGLAFRVNNGSWWIAMPASRLSATSSI